MAKKSMVARDVKREKLAGKYAAKRAELKRIIADPNVEFEEKQAAIFAFEASAGRESGAGSQSLPRDGTAARLLPQVRFGPQQAA